MIPICCKRVGQIAQVDRDLIHADGANNGRVGPS
jgi:hypothetical protein